jgi:hypothetical protein
MMALRSQCGRCQHEGTVSTDQRQRFGKGVGPPIAGVRFYCACGNIWIVVREEAELHTLFLKRAGL